MRLFLLEDETGFAPRNAMLKAVEGHELTLAVSIAEAKAKFKGPYEVILLDHDMHGFPGRWDIEDCGTAFARWLVDKGKLKAWAKPRIILHSQNTTARRKQAEVLADAGFKVEERAFDSGYCRWLKESLI